MQSDLLKKVLQFYKESSSILIFLNLNERFKVKFYQFYQKFYQSFIKVLSKFYQFYQSFISFIKVLSKFYQIYQSFIKVLSNISFIKQVLSVLSHSYFSFLTIYLIYRKQKSNV
jgi:hypothetical protein